MSGRRAIDVYEYGPAMRQLSEKQIRFVLAYFELQNGAEAARQAGYSDAAEGAKVVAHRLLHSPKVIAAMQEEARRRYVGLLPKALTAQEEIVGNPEHKDRLRAAMHISAAAGIAGVIEHRVEHVLSVSEQFAELIRLGKSQEEILANLPPEEKRQVLELVKKGDGSYS